MTELVFPQSKLNYFSLNAKLELFESILLKVKPPKYNSGHTTLFRTFNKSLTVTPSLDLDGSRSVDKKLENLDFE